MMRKYRLIEAVAPDEFPFIARERELDIEQVAYDFFGTALSLGVEYPTKTKVRSAETLFIEPQVVEIDLDPYAEIDCCEALKSGQSLEGHLRILFPVDGNNILAATAKEFVDT